MKVHAIRLIPGQDLKQELKRLVEKEQIQAGIILTVVGSLTRANLRLAGRQKSTVIENDLEIVSCVGTLCQDGMHIHIAISDAQGQTFGGHVSDGCIVRTTAEVVIGEIHDFIFYREMDKETGCLELQINRK